MSSDFNQAEYESARRAAAEAYARMTPQERAAMRGNRYTHGLSRRTVRAQINRAMRATRQPATPQAIAAVAAAKDKRARKAAKRRADGGMPHAT